MEGKYSRFSVPLFYYGGARGGHSNVLMYQIRTFVLKALFYVLCDWPKRWKHGNRNILLLVDVMPKQYVFVFCVFLFVIVHLNLEFVDAR